VWSQLGLADTISTSHPGAYALAGCRRPSMRALALHASERPMSGTGTVPDSSTMTTEIDPFASTTWTLVRAS
jgi:hypothetical protein